jgi:hypothetical protein
MRYTGIAISITLFLTSPAQAQTSFDGDGPCYDWTYERSAHSTTWWKESGRAGEKRAFVFGFITGLTTSSRVYPADMLDHPELMGKGESVDAWIDKYCRADPLPR